MLKKTLLWGVAAGTLLEYETLELRIHPPNVVIEDVLDDTTMVTIDSANRPGTLIEVRQVAAHIRSGS